LSQVQANSAKRVCASAADDFGHRRLGTKPSPSAPAETRFKIDRQLIQAIEKGTPKSYPFIEANLLHGPGRLGGRRIVAEGIDKNCGHCALLKWVRMDYQGYLIKAITIGWPPQTGNTLSAVGASGVIFHAIALDTKKF